MVNWTSVSYYILPLECANVYDQENGLRKILNALSMEAVPNVGGPFFGISDVSRVGPAVFLAGSGRWGVDIGFTEACANEIYKGVVIRQEVAGDVLTTIHVNNELVFERVVGIDYGADMDDFKPIWYEFQGRTEQEQSAMSALKRVHNKREEENIIERELMRLKLKREGRIQ